MINEETIGMMKDHVILVNTSRGALIKTDDLIAGIRSRKFFGIGLDVYEEYSYSQPQFLSQYPIITS